MVDPRLRLGSKAETSVERSVLRTVLQVSISLSVLTRDGVSGHGESRLGPRPPAAPHRRHPRVPHLLERVGSEGGAIAAAAVEHDGRVVGRDRGLDVAFDHALAEVMRARAAGRGATRPARGRRRDGTARRPPASPARRRCSPPGYGAVRPRRGGGSPANAPCRCASIDVAVASIPGNETSPPARDGLDTMA